MKSVADLLRDGDPVAGDHELGDEFGEEAVRRMRQTVLAHRPGERDGTGQAWRGFAVLASIVVGAFALGTWLADARIDDGAARLTQIERPPATEPPPARQVQFVTPRGTRVVWVLQADSSSQEGIR